MSLKYTIITKEAFTTTLSRYPALVPPTLHSLDTSRYTSIPATLHQRHTETSHAYLEKSELATLVEWKLKHGTFRPKLLQLVQSNAEDVVEKTTREAFGAGTGVEAVKGAVKVLTGLKGVGPATASLVLGVRWPGEVPFFSDELFRWVMWDEKGVGKGWKRSIKYDMKEYAEMLGRVGELRERLGVRAVDCEKVAWVLGKEKVDLEDSGADGAQKEGGEAGGQIEDEPDKKGEGVQDADEQEKKDAGTGKAKKAAKKGTKRKAEDAKPTAEGSRRSGRRKQDVFYGED